MKRLSNVSPFILLLIPVFIMALFTIMPVSRNNDNEAALKTSASTSTTNIVTNITK